jgi:hypothetical protein
MADVIELPNARVQVEERPGYLYLIETGTLKSIQEVGAYAAAIEAIIVRTGIARAIIDARDEIGDPPPEVRHAMWDWLAAPDRGFQMVAFILPSEMAVARVNMTALSRRAQVRAFDNVQQAQRWLTRGPRQSSMSIPTIGAPTPPSGVRPGSRAPSSVPPTEAAKKSSSTPPAADERDKRSSEIRRNGGSDDDRGNGGGSRVA